MVYQGDGLAVVCEESYGKFNRSLCRKRKDKHWSDEDASRDQSTCPSDRAGGQSR